jgi:hypothetical protein
MILTNLFLSKLLNQKKAIFTRFPLKKLMAFDILKHLVHQEEKIFN